MPFLTNDNDLYRGVIKTAVGSFLDSFLGWFCMNPILVIGATGTVGRQVVSRLAATGMQVRAMARLSGSKNCLLRDGQWSTQTRE